MDTTKECLQLIQTMDNDIERAIGILTGRIVQPVDPADALKLTQATLNLAHVKGLLTAQAKDALTVEAKTATKKRAGAS